MSQNGLIMTALSNGMVQISGRDTFTHRIALKTLGGTWNAESKAWIMPPGFTIADLGSQTTTEASTNGGAAAASSGPAAPVAVRRIPSNGTFTVKEDIKKAGGRWDPITKEWIVPVDFDDSIIPKVEKKPADAAEQGPRLRAPPCCSICRSPHHRRNKCDYVCTKCGKVGQHLSGRCTPPDDDPVGDEDRFSAGW